MKKASSRAKPSSTDKTASPGPTQRLEDYEPYNNRNLSSVIAKITDDGPANLKNTRDQRRDIQSPHRASVGPRLVQDDVYIPSIAKNDERQQPMSQSFAFDGAGIGDDENYRHGNKQGKWQQIVLLILLVAVATMGYTLYRLDLNADQLSDALDLTEEKMLLAAKNRTMPTDVAPEISGLDAAISEIKQDLQTIKAGQQDASNRVNMNMVSELKPQLLQTAIMPGYASELKVELVQISKQVQESGTVFGKAEMDATATAVDEVAKVISRPVQAVPGQFIVTLASFSSRDKALAANEILQQSGALPLIEEVLVNDETVYRISVDGFTSRAVANEFIAVANEQYGFEGGWIREK